jgi:hypothetical protein
MGMPGATDRRSRDQNSMELLNRKRKRRVVPGSRHHIRRIALGSGADAREHPSSGGHRNLLTECGDRYATKVTNNAVAL